MIKIMAASIGGMLVLASSIGAIAQTRPDLTGVWMAPFEIHAAGFPMRAGSTEWAPASDGDPRTKHIPTLDELRKLDDARNARLIASGGDPATLNPPPKPQPYLTAAGRAAKANFDPKIYEQQDLLCYPFTVFNRVGGGLGALDIVQGATQMMMATEINGNNFPRIVYLDGRSDAKSLPSFEGHTVGRWNGATLHLETTKIKGGYFNRNWPVSEEAKLLEDYTVIGSGTARTLEIVETLVDPMNYAEPLTRASYLDWRPDLEVQDFPCEEGLLPQLEMHAAPAG